MHNTTNKDQNVKRTENGVIDFEHYIRAARTTRREAKTETLAKISQQGNLLLRSTKASLRAAFRTVTFWNIPALGTATVHARNSK